MENKKEKYYTNSSGEQIDISTMHSTHIENAWIKKSKELFDCKNKDEFSKKLEEVNNLKEEYFKRLNKFYDTLGDE